MSLGLTRTAKPVSRTRVRHLLVSFLLLAGCERTVVERTPQALADRARALAKPDHEGAISASALEFARRSSTGVGRVVALDRTQGLITLNHIPASDADWPQMGVALRVRPASLMSGVKVGDQVSFHLEFRGKVPEIVDLQPR